jgi:hypothetical protein
MEDGCNVIELKSIELLVNSIRNSLLELPTFQGRNVSDVYGEGDDGAGAGAA